MQRFTATSNDDGMRLSRFVQRVCRGLPDAAMYKAFRNRRIKVNGRRAAPDARLAAGDVVELYLNDEYFPDGPSRAYLPTAAGPLPPYGTVYQDGGIAVLYKPAGVLSHRDAKAAPTLLDAFADSLVRTGQYTPGEENAFAPALCNRL
ncbi:RluA family pseudouridine synthase, partial [Ruminococcaceae bacterium OttesenSCG-928-O06]|nr:RluA family pseudouridine synthase [Ruminococcaceae bacterium OttesenSCG-928-O06]